MRLLSPSARPWLLLAFCLGLLLPTLETPTLVQRRELRVVLPARAMAEGGSWLVPEFLGQPRLRKPPLMYWLVAASFRLAGATQSTLAARLPSALAGMALILSLYAFGSQWIGRRRAFWSAGVAASSFLFLRHARVGGPEILLGLFIALAVFSAYGIAMGRGGMGAWLGFSVFCGLGFLTKGPPGPGIPLATLVAFTLASRESRRRLLNWRALVALACFAAVAVPWYVAVMSHGHTRVASETALRNELSETFEGTDHPGNIAYYLYMVPGALMPWGLLVPFAVWALWRFGRHHAGARFLLCWIVGSFVALTIVPNKQVHYSLLMVPQTALAVGYFLGFAESRAASWMGRFSRLYPGVLLGILAACGCAIALSPAFMPALSPVPLAIIGATLIAISIAAMTRPPSGAFAPRVLAVWLGTALALYAFANMIYPAHDAESLVPDFAARARDLIPPQASVWVAEDRNAPGMEFYLGRRLTVLPPSQDAWATAKPSDAIILRSDRKHPLRPPLGPAPALDMTRKDLRLLLYIKEP